MFQIPTVPAMPQTADAQFLLGSLLNQAEDQAGAERSLRAALALDPEHVLSSCALVDLLVKQDRCAQAFPLAQLAIRLAPQEPDSHIAMGRVYEEIDPRIARRAYKKAVQLDPESPTASMELATFDFNHGSKSGIVRAVARAVAWRPQNQVARPLVDLTLIVLTLSLGKIHGSCLALTILVQLVLWWFGAPARLCLAPAVPALISALLLSWVICRPVRTNLPDGGRHPADALRIRLGAVYTKGICGACVTAVSIVSCVTASLSHMCGRWTGRRYARNSRHGEHRILH